MPDSPDWSKYLPLSKRYSLQDLGELAARIGSPITYDRRGEVLWYDQMQEGSSLWQEQAEGIGSGVKVVGTNAYWPGFALELTAGSDGQMLAAIYRYSAPSSLSKWGFEVAWWISTPFTRLDLNLNRHDGVNFQQSGLRVLGSTPKLQYKNSLGSYTDLVALAAQNSPNPTYHNLKFVADMAESEYVRVLLDENEYDLSGVSFYETVEGPIDYNYIQVLFVGSAGFNRKMQVGNVVFTSNEP